MGGGGGGGGGGLWGVCTEARRRLLVKKLRGTEFRFFHFTVLRKCHVPLTLHPFEKIQNQSVVPEELDSLLKIYIIGVRIASSFLSLGLSCMHKCHVFGGNDALSRSIYQQVFKVLQLILLISSHFLTASRSLINVGSISLVLQPDLRIHDNLMTPLLFLHSSICEKYLTCAKNGTKPKSLFWAQLCTRIEYAP